MTALAVSAFKEGRLTDDKLIMSRPILLTCIIIHLILPCVGQASSQRPSELKRASALCERLFSQQQRPTLRLNAYNSGLFSTSDYFVTEKDLKDLQSVFEKAIPYLGELRAPAEIWFELSPLFQDAGMAKFMLRLKPILDGSAICEGRINRPLALHEFAHLIFQLTYRYRLAKRLGVLDLYQEYEALHVAAARTTTNAEAKPIIKRMDAVQDRLAEISASQYGHRYFYYRHLFGSETAPFEELFADTLSVIAESDLSIMRKGLEGSKGAEYRDFAISVNPRGWKVEETDVHHFFTPVRGWIGQYLRKNEFDQAKATKLLEVLMELSIGLKLSGRFKPESPEAMNRFMIMKLRQELGPV